MYKNLAVENSHAIFGTGALINISTQSKDKISDSMTAAWSCNFAYDELLLVLDTNHTTVQNLLENPKLVVSMPRISQLDNAIKLGSIHGRDCGDKFEHTKVEAIQSEKYQIKVPKDALAYFEGFIAQENIELLKSKGIALVHIENLYVDEEFYDEKEQDFSRGLLNSIRLSSKVFIHGGEVVKSPW